MPKNANNYENIYIELACAYDSSFNHLLIYFRNLIVIQYQLVVNIKI